MVGDGALLYYVLHFPLFLVQHLLCYAMLRTLVPAPPPFSSHLIIRHRTATDLILTEGGSANSLLKYIDLYFWFCWSALAFAEVCYCPKLSWTYIGISFHLGPSQQICPLSVPSGRLSDVSQPPYC